MKTKKYLVSILSASLLFSVSVRAEEVEKKEQKQDDAIVKKIENKTQENAPVAKQEEAKVETSKEEKSNVLAYTIAATGGAAAGLVVGSYVMKNCRENGVASAYKKDAVKIKTIFGMKKEEITAKQEKLVAQKDELGVTQKLKPNAANEIKIKEIDWELKYCQRALNAQNAKNAEVTLSNALDELEVSYVNKNAENLIKKIEVAKAAVLKPEVKVNTPAKVDKPALPAATTPEKK
jgi:hypothetical protein